MATADPELNNASIFPAAPTASAAAPVTEHEFGEAENRVFAGLASNMRFVSTATVVMGVIFVLVAVWNLWRHGAPVLIPSVLQSMTGGLWVVVGWWLRGVAESFQRIVDTRGSDVSHLMRAVSELDRTYALQRLYFVIVGALCLLASVAILIMLAFFFPFARGWL